MVSSSEGGRCGGERERGAGRGKGEPPDSQPRQLLRVLRREKCERMLAYNVRTRNEAQEIREISGNEAGVGVREE